MPYPPEYDGEIPPGIGLKKQNKILICVRVVLLASYFLLIDSGKLFSFGAGGDGQLGHGDTEVGMHLSSLHSTSFTKKPDLYYFETIKMTSQVYSKFLWRIRFEGEYSL